MNFSCFVRVSPGLILFRRHDGETQKKRETKKAPVAKL